MISIPVLLSSAPVGSSARISAGSVTSARAIATRCCWPPESWLGLVVGAVGQADRGQRASARPPRARGAGTPA